MIRYQKFPFWFVQNKLVISMLRNNELNESDNWFGNSKVIDDSGKPLVVYHGTTASFNSFKRIESNINHKFSKNGFFFTKCPEAASDYAMGYAGAEYARPGFPGLFIDTPAKLGTGTANVIPVFLKIEKPLIVSSRGARSPDQWFDRTCCGKPLALAMGFEQHP